MEERVGAIENTLRILSEIYASIIMARNEKRNASLGGCLDAAGNGFALRSVGGGYTRLQRVAVRGHYDRGRVGAADSAGLGMVSAHHDVRFCHGPQSFHLTASIVFVARYVESALRDDGSADQDFNRAGGRRSRVVCASLLCRFAL